MNDETTLLPCPFCGGEAELTGFDAPEYWVWCPKCKASADMHTGMENAIAAWNARAEQTCRNVHEEWEKTSFTGAETSFCCSECGAHYFDAESYYAGLADADGDLIRTNYCPNCGAKVVQQ